MVGVTNSTKVGGNDNYYEIALKENTFGHKNKGRPQLPYSARRAGLMNSLHLPKEVKGPGFQYFQRMHSFSNMSPSLLKQVPRNSKSSDFDSNHNVSDDSSLLDSANSEVPHSCSSSLSAHSSSSWKAPLKSSASTQGNGGTSSKSSSGEERSDEKAIGEQLSLGDSENTIGGSTDLVNVSHSTLTLRNQNNYSSASLSQKAPKSGQRYRPSLKASSTSNIPTPSVLLGSNVRGSTTDLTKPTFREKPKNLKERRKLSKKMYDDNEGDDLITADDLGLFFNVPTLKSTSGLYLHENVSGRLEPSYQVYDNIPRRSNSSSTTLPSLMEEVPRNGRSELSPVSENDDIRRDSLAEGDFTFSMDSTDNDITQKISEMYSQQCVSNSRLARLSRDQEVKSKLPNFIKSQSSLEDLHLISPEKINLVDQTRPIHLPPKDEADKAKHNKEVQKILNNFEANRKNTNEARNKMKKTQYFNQQAWSQLMAMDVNHFNKKIYKDRQYLRSLAWESICPELVAYDYFFRILSHDDNVVTAIKGTFKNSEDKLQNLSHLIKSSKDIEFGRIIDSSIRSPFFQSILKEFLDNEKLDIDKEKLKHNFRELLYIMSLSDDGFTKLDELFLIPFLLILFWNQCSLEDVFLIIELLKHQVFDQAFTKELNKALSGWSNSKKFGKSSLQKFLHNFNNLEEFKDLNTNIFFEILVKLNDKMSLSLSAPSTPVVPQSAQFAPLNPVLTPELKESQESLEKLQSTGIASVSGSTTLQIGLKLLQLVVTYTLSKSGLKHNLNLLQSFLVVIFKYYHINWNDWNELLNSEKSIKLNNSSDPASNLEVFVDKWKDVFNNF